MNNPDGCEVTDLKQLAVLGAGSWGTALAIALASRFESICLWARDAGRAAEIQNLRENKRYLPGFPLPPNVCASHDLSATLPGADLVIVAVPSHHLRIVLASAAALLPPFSPVVSATKGIEEGTLFRMSQVMADVLSQGPRPIAVLSGPTFAKEVAAGEPAAVVIASRDLQVAALVQHALSTPALRFYASQDIVGVEIGAALKNVIAIGAGICSGLGLGGNSVAALVTRGLAEISRLAVALGANPRTLSGLAGLGDLVLTATGDLSRNRYVGAQLGQGRKLADILAHMEMVAEGVFTCRAACRLGLRMQIELPIIDKMREVLFEAKDPCLAIRELMDRPLIAE